MSPTGHEIQMYRNIDSIARSLARIANAMEQQVYGVTSAEAVKIQRELADAQPRIYRSSNTAEGASAEAPDTVKR